MMLPFFRKQTNQQTQTLSHWFIVRGVCLTLDRLAEGGMRRESIELDRRRGCT